MPRISTRVERESDAAFHIGRSAISQARDSRYTCNAIWAQSCRGNLEIFQKGEQTEQYPEWFDSWSTVG